MPRTFLILAPVAALVLALGAIILGGGGRPVPSPTTASTPATSPTEGAAATPAISPYPLAAGEAWILIGENNRITLIRPDGSGRHTIPAAGGPAVVNPTWSADGNQVIYEGNGADGSHLWVSNADGTNAHQLTPTPVGCPDGDCVEAVQPAWSPDGGSIAYIAPEHAGGGFVKTSLMVLDVATGATTEIYSTTDEGLARPSWSPDSRRIVLEIDRFVGPAEGELRDTALGIVDLDGADHTPALLTKRTLLAGYPVWHPASDLIVFRTNPINNATGQRLDPEAPSNLYTIRSDGSGLTMVTNNDVGGDSVRAPCWTGDGRILFTAHSASSDVEVLRIIDADGTNEVSATGTTITLGQGRWRPGT